MRRIFRPTPASALIVTDLPCTCANSEARTDVAPVGIAAPVMIRIANPDLTWSLSASSPAVSAPITANVTGLTADAPAISAERTAKPSFNEESTDGQFATPYTSSAQTRPRALSSETTTGSRV